MVGLVEPEGKFEMSFAVTNKGYLDFAEKYGSLTFTAYFSGPSLQAYSGFFVLSVLSMHKKCFLSFPYPYPLMTTKKATEFVDSFLKILLSD